MMTCLTRAHERARAARVSAPPTLPRLPRQDPGLHLFFASTRCEGLEDDARRISATVSLRDYRRTSQVTNGLGSWTLDLGPWILAPGSWNLCLGPWGLDIGCWTSGRWIFDIGHSFLDLRA